MAAAARMSREATAAATTTATRGARGAFPAASDVAAPPDAAVREAVESVLVAEATGGEPIRRPIAVAEEEEGEEQSESAAARPPPLSVCRAVDRILRFGGGGEGGGQSGEVSSVAASAAEAAAAASKALACYGETVRPAVVRDVARNDGGEAADGGGGGGGDVGTEEGANVAAVVPGGASAVLRYEAFLSELVAAATVGAAGGSLSAGRGGSASKEDRPVGARRDGASAADGSGLREFRVEDSGEKHGGAVRLR